MSRTWVSGIAAALVVFSVGSASASLITGLTNTGVNVTGVIDNAWTITGGASVPALSYPSPAYTNTTNNAFPIPPWVPNSPISSWDTPYNPLNSNTDPSVTGSYIFSTSFNFAGSLADAFITGQFAADNSLATIKLNGTTIYTGPGAPTSQFGSWTAFGATTGFVLGQNTLEFELLNYALNGGNPGGLNVQFLTATTSVPEPATWAMMLLGFLGMRWLAYRRRKAVIGLRVA